MVILPIKEQEDLVVEVLLALALLEVVLDLLIMVVVVEQAVVVLQAVHVFKVDKQVDQE